MATYNLMTTQKGRSAMWAPEELEVMLVRLDEGDVSILEKDMDRVNRFVKDRHDQLVSYGITEMAPVGMMAGTLALCAKEFHDFTGYIRHVKECLLAKHPYMMPDQWLKSRAIA